MQLMWLRRLAVGPGMSNITATSPYIHDALFSQVDARWHEYIGHTTGGTRAVRRRRRAAAADSMSASRRRRFRGVLTSCRTLAIMWLDFCIMPFTMKLGDLQQ